VSLHGGNISFQLSSPEYSAELAFNEHSQQGADGVSPYRNACADNQDGKNPPRRRQRFDFTETHRTDRDHRHVESIEEGHAFDKVIAECSECDSAE
jgi:hypothetical protein